jgi:hypothetical protein
MRDIPESISICVNEEFLGALALHACFGDPELGPRMMYGSSRSCVGLGCR